MSNVKHDDLFSQLTQKGYNKCITSDSHARKRFSNITENALKQISGGNSNDCIYISFSKSIKF